MLKIRVSWKGYRDGVVGGFVSLYRSREIAWGSGWKGSAWR